MRKTKNTRAHFQLSTSHATMMILLLLLLSIVILSNPNEKGSSLAILPMGYIVPHTRRLMMVKTAHKLSDFSWIYKGRFLIKIQWENPLKLTFLNIHWTKLSFVRGN
jgi:hypothetical protein